jgi:hypothetical protein
VVESSVFDYAGTLAHSHHLPPTDSDGLAMANITNNIGALKITSFYF